MAAGDTIQATLVNKQSFEEKMDAIANAISLPTDAELDIHSDHPIQNQAVANAIGDIQGAIDAIYVIIGGEEN